MRFTPPGRFKSLEEFAARWRSIDPAGGVVPEPSDVASAFATSIEVYGRRIGNRFAVQPMEGWDGTRDGTPTDDTFRRWQRFGQSGAKLVWGGEAYAVSRDGRANPNQLFLNDDIDAAEPLRALLDAVRAAHRGAGLSTDDLLVGLQLTHSGRFARPDGDARPRLAHHHSALAEKFQLARDTPILTDEQLERIADRFVRAAHIAEEAGFDFVDVKCCHGYLLHELLAARTRPGPYGGSLAHRTALLMRIIDGIETACPNLPVAVRLSIVDLAPFVAGNDGVGVVHPAVTPPYRDGFGVAEDDPARPSFDEPLKLLGMLSTRGVRLVNVTLGSPYYCPHRQRPAAYPPSDGYDPPEDPLVGVAAHLEAVRACKRALPELTLVGSGYSYLQEFLPLVGAWERAHGHVDIVGLGRMMLSYPELPRDVLAARDLDRRRICRTFSDCTTAPRHGLPSGCYPLDQHYKGSASGVQLRTIKKERRA